MCRCRNICKSAALADKPMSVLCLCLMEKNEMKTETWLFLCDSSLCRDAPLGSLENGTEPEDHILPETDSRCMLVFRNQVARNQELNCPIHSSAFYSLLRLGGHLLRLKVKAFLHVRVWGSLTSHNVQSCQGSQSLRSSVGHTWLAYHFTFYTFGPSLGISSIIICLILICDNIEQF